MKIALIQLNVSDQPYQNLPTTIKLIDKAAQEGAEFILTPEVTNCISLDRSHQEKILHPEKTDPTLIALREKAFCLKKWILIGSIALKTDDDDGRFANRSFLVNPSGNIVAKYDKIHMFDANISENERYKESSTYRPGNQCVCVNTDFGKIGLTICYDLRFAHLYRDLAMAGARIISVPSAFSPLTGAAHWEILTRARAIETGCFIIAPAQTGRHTTCSGKSRQTYGHSLVVSPWGEIIAKMREEVGYLVTEINLTEVDIIRSRVPSLSNQKVYNGPIDER